MCLLEIKAANPFHVPDKRNQLKLDVNPVAPFAFAQYEFLILHPESCGRSSGSTETVKGSSVGGDPLRNVLSGPIRLRHDL